MRKNSIAIIGLAFLASCFMVSCSTEAFDTNQPVKGAKIVIPAQKMSTKAVDADGKATFLFSENVYIANSGGTIDANAIHPSAESASTTFTGTLAGTYSQGEKITVLYNTNKSGVVDYSGQDGSIGSVKDAGYAEDVEIVSYSEGVLTTESAKIQNLQSIFKFTFTNGSTNAEISGIRFVRVFSTNSKLVSSYNAKEKSSTYGPVTISRSDDLTGSFIYAALRFDSNPGDEIVFQVVDNAGNVYSGSKVAPSGGFENGNIYNSNVVVNRYTFSTSASTKVCISPGDLGSGDRFLEPFQDFQVDASYFAGSNNVSPLSNKTVFGISGWHIPDDGSSGALNEMNYIISSRPMATGVNRYYRASINGSACLLLPPDETQDTDVESLDAANYLKYLKKGFVLLTKTNVYNNGWGSLYANAGIYKVQQKTRFLYFDGSTNPTFKSNIVSSSAANNAKSRVRLLHTVE